MFRSKTEHLSAFPGPIQRTSQLVPDRSKVEIEILIVRLCLRCDHGRLKPENWCDVRREHASSDEHWQRRQTMAMSNQRHDKVHVYTPGHS